ncbi:MAG: aminoacyl-tRNA hydrolase [Acidobacteriales bacterium]|nr:aminoacyl-tRNA hydrolase [Terriglobales bacterium]
MKLIVGLGNPGPEYEQTPHNLGFLVVDLLAEQAGVAVNNRRCRALTGKARIAGHEVLLAKPETFMNLSGNAVRELVAERQSKEEFDPRKDLIVIHDELAFPLGTLRIKERGSAGGHNGVESVISAVGQEFIRVRLGIAPDHPLRDGAEYVLTAWKKKDLPLVGEMLDRAADAVTAILVDGVVATMNRFHRRDEAVDENE